MKVNFCAFHPLIITNFPSINMCMLLQVCGNHNYPLIIALETSVTISQALKKLSGAQNLQQKKTKRSY